MEGENNNRRISITARIIFLVAAGICFAIYYLTAYRTITWWDSSEYTLAAVTFGIPHPPGSLLLVIVGAIVNFIPFGISSAFKLNLFAGFLAAATTAMIAVTAGRMMTLKGAGSPASLSVGLSAGIGICLASLGFAFSQTVWTFAVRFTPYILTPLFTVLIVYVLLKWWETAHRDHSWRWLAIAALIIGLDFSVHRTNALLLPGILVWILVCYPKTLIKWRTWVGAIVGLIVGLSLNFVMIPIAMRNPLLNANDPRTLSRLWDYVHVKQAGGGFLLSLFPRNADLLSQQAMDWLNAVAYNFFTIDGPLGPLGLLTGLLALFGLLLLIMRQPRLGLAYLAMMILTAVSTVLYFNIPETFFRPFDRHYLPTFVLFILPAAYAAGLLMKEAWNPSQRLRSVTTVMVAALVVIGPTAQSFRNFHRVDGSKMTGTLDIASGMLLELAPNAILFTNGDNDTFPLWAMQGVDSVRPDVTVINIPLLNTDWYAASLIERDTALRVSYAADSLRSLSHQRADSIPRIITVPLTAAADFFGLVEDSTYPDSIDVTFQTTSVESHYLVSDLIFADILANNISSRPIYFAGTVSPVFYSAYSDRLRREGCSLRLLPVPASVDTTLLRLNLTDNYDYHSFTTTDLPVEEITANFGVTLTLSWLTLADARLEAGDVDGCIAALDEMEQRLPPERLEIPENLANAVELLKSAARTAMPGSSRSLDTSEM